MSMKRELNTFNNKTSNLFRCLAIVYMVSIKLQKNLNKKLFIYEILCFFVFINIKTFICFELNLFFVCMRVYDLILHFVFFPDYFIDNKMSIYLFKKKMNLFLLEFRFSNELSL